MKYFFFKVFLFLFPILIVALLQVGGASFIKRFRKHSNNNLYQMSFSFPNIYTQLHVNYFKILLKRQRPAFVTKYQCNLPITFVCLTNPSIQQLEIMRLKLQSSRSSIFKKKKGIAKCTKMSRSSYIISNQVRVG